MEWEGWKGDGGDEGDGWEDWEVESAVSDGSAFEEEEGSEWGGEGCGDELFEDDVRSLEEFTAAEVAELIAGEDITVEEFSDW